MSPRRSLWLVPEGEAAVRLQAAIDRLAALFGGPRFSPHLTLLGEIDAPEEEEAPPLRSLVARLAPLRVTAGAIETTPEIFRCLYLRIAASRPLLDAHRCARDTLCPRAPARSLMPHVSLLYGRLSPERREEAAACCVELNLPADISLPRLELWATEAAPDAWQRIETHGLGQTALES